MDDEGFYAPFNLLGLRFEAALRHLEGHSGLRLNGDLFILISFHRVYFLNTDEARVFVKALLDPNLGLRASHHAPVCVDAGVDRHPLRLLLTLLARRQGRQTVIPLFHVSLTGSPLLIDLDIGGILLLAKIKYLEEVFVVLDVVLALGARKVRD